MPKQTAKNNDFLRRVKRAVGETAFREASRLLNEKGQWAAREYLMDRMPQTLDQYLDRMGDIFDAIKEWPK